jgi:hypothetical protein
MTGARLKGLYTRGWTDDHAEQHYSKGVDDTLKIYRHCGVLTDIFNFYSHDSQGDSRSMLASLDWAVKMGAERIYMIEEDVLVSMDFFRWHRHAQEMGFPLTVGYALPGDKRVSEDADPTLCIACSRSHSIGVCFSRNLALKLLEHNTPDYYHSFYTMDLYLKKYFREYPGKDDLQWDGLLRRIFWRDKLKALYPLKPRAYHCGWYGLNRDEKDPWPDMPLDRKTMKVGEVIFDHEKLQQMSGGKEDCTVYNLTEKPWDHFEVM